MTRIINDQPGTNLNELQVPFSGDRDAFSADFRRVQDNTDKKIRRMSASVYPEGFITTGLNAAILEVTNLVPWGEDFTQNPGWEPQNGLAIVSSAGVDREGELAMTRLLGSTTADSFIEAALGIPASGRKVLSVDAKLDSTAAFTLSFFDGVAEVGTTLFTLSNHITRFEIAVDGTWSGAATFLSVRIRPLQGGTVLVGRVQVEDFQPQDDLKASSYVPTAGSAASAPGNRVIVTRGSAQLYGLPRPLFEAQILTYDPLVTNGLNWVFYEYSELYRDAMDNRPLMDNPITGDPGQDSAREVTQLVTIDTSNPAVPLDPTPGALQFRMKYCTPLYVFDRAAATLVQSVPLNNLDISRMNGLLDGVRIETQTVKEDALDLIATEGQPGLLAAQARRMNNVTGNFLKTRGGNLPPIAPNAAVTDKISLKINPADGYTQGKAFYLDNPVIITLPLETSTQQEFAESFAYATGTHTYPLQSTPVTSIVNLSAIVLVPGGAGGGIVTRSATSQQDHIYVGPEDRPIFTVSLVQSTDLATTYVLGVDYSWTGQTLTWTPNNLGAKEPVIGASYNVTYQYTRSFGPTEYTFTTNSITFTNTGTLASPLPINGFAATVDYFFGLGRTDLIYLGAGLTAAPGSAVGAAEIGVIKGVPSRNRVLHRTPDGCMPLWAVPMAYNSSVVTPIPLYTPGLSMADLDVMQGQVQALLYDMAVVIANLNLRDRNTGTKLIQTDAFIDASLFDMGAAWIQSAGQRAAGLDSVINPGRLTMAADLSTRTLAIDTANTTMATVGAWSGLPFINSTQASQDGWSADISVNPYDYAKQTGGSTTTTTQPPPIPPLIEVSTCRTHWENHEACGPRRREPPEVSFTVRGSQWPVSIAGIRILLDGTQIGTVDSDASGKFTFRSEQSINLESGLVEAICPIQPPWGNNPPFATATFQESCHWPRIDPVGQSMSFNQSGDVTNVSLWFDAKPSNNTDPVIVALRTMQVGYPTPTVLAFVTLLPSDVHTDGTPTVVTWPEPVPYKSGDYYTVVAASANGAYRVQYGQLGQPNLALGATTTTTTTPGTPPVTTTTTTGAWIGTVVNTTAVGGPTTGYLSRYPKTFPPSEAVKTAIRQNEKPDTFYNNGMSAIGIAADAALISDRGYFESELPVNVNGTIVTPIAGGAGLQTLWGTPLPISAFYLEQPRTDVSADNIYPHVKVMTTTDGVTWTFQNNYTIPNQGVGAYIIPLTDASGAAVAPVCTGIRVIVIAPGPRGAIRWLAFNVYSLTGASSTGSTPGVIGGTTTTTTTTTPIFTANPYEDGVMLVSADGNTYSALQDSDLRFEAAMARYTGPGVLRLLEQDFTNIGGITGFDLYCFYHVVGSATLDFQYSVDSGATWNSFDPNQMVNLTAVATKCMIRIMGTPDAASAFAGVGIDNESIILYGLKNALLSSYVSLAETLRAATTSTKTYVRAYIPQNASIAVYVSTDSGVTWTAGALTGVPTQISPTAVPPAIFEFEYDATPPSGTLLRTRIDLITTNPCFVPFLTEYSTIVF